MARPKAKPVEAPDLPTVEPTVEHVAKQIRTLYGDMVDPLTGVRYGVVPQDIERVSPWVQSQLDAKKMEWL